MQLQNKTYKQITLCKLEFLCHNNNWQYSVGIHPPTTYQRRRKTPSFSYGDISRVIIPLDERKSTLGEIV